LLTRVRDDRKMSIAAYQTLFHGSVLFGIRKQAMAEKGMPELRDKLKRL